MNTVFLKIQGIDGTTKIVDDIGDSLKRLTKIQNQQDKQATSYKTASYNAAMKDIRRMESDRSKWAKTAAAEISRTDKLLADTKVKEMKRATSESIRTLSQIGKASEQTAKQSAGIFQSVLGGSFFGNVGSTAVSFFMRQFGTLASAVGSVVADAVKIANERAGAFKGLESIAQFKGLDTKAVAETLKNFRLVKAGIVDIGDASTAMKNLLASNFTLAESAKLFERFSDAAAFGKQSALGFGEAIRGATEGIKNGNSQLVDNAGVTKNLSVILKEMGKSEQDVMNITTNASVRQAIFNGLLKETTGQVGDADKLMQGWTGTVSALTTAKKNLLAEIGNIIIQNPELIAVIKLTTQSIDQQTESYKKADSASKKATNSMVSDFARLSLEAYITAKQVNAAFLTAGTAVAAGMAGISIAFQTTLVGLNKVFNAMLVDPVNFLVKGLNEVISLQGKVGAALGLPTLPGLPTLSRLPEDMTGANNAAQQLKFILEDGKKVLRDFPKEADALRTSFEKLRKEADAQLNTRSVKIGGTVSSTADPTTKGGGTGAKSRLQNVGIEEFADNQTKARFEKALRNLSPSLKAQIFEYADKYGIPTSLALAQIFSESSFNTRAVSPFNKNVGSSAFGLTQQLPATASRFTNGKVTGEMLKNNPELALTAWGKYMAFLFDRYGDWELATLAYHQGEGTVDKLVNAISRGANITSFFKYTKGAKAGKEKFGSKYVKQIIALAGLRGDQQFQTPGQIDSKDYRERQAERIRGIFRGVAADSVESRTGITETVERQLDIDEEHIANLRESLGIEEGIRNVLMRQRNLAEEIVLTFLAEEINQKNELLDIERDLDVLRRQSTDAAFSGSRLELSTKRELLNLERERVDLQDRLAGFEANSDLRIANAGIQDKIDLMQREEDAVISLNRAYLEMSQKGVYSQTQANARFIDFLNQNTKSITEIYSDARIGVVSSFWDTLDGQISKVTDRLGVFGDVAKQIIMDLVKLATSKIFSSLFGGSGMGGGNSGGGLGAIFGSIFGGGAGGGLFNTGNRTPSFNPNADMSSIFSGSSGGGGSMWGGWGGIKADQQRANQIFGGGSGGSGLGFNSGTMAGIGAIATMAGGAIGGRFGNVLSMAGTGASIGAMFGPWGAVIGGGIGAIAGLFMGDPKRKADKKENLPKLKQGFQDAFKEFSDLISDVSSLRVDPDSAMGRGRELRAQIASGFGIAFQSKKYKKQAQQLIKQQLAAIDAVPAGLMEQLKNAVDMAKAAGERRQRILPEFADGGSVSRFFRNNFAGLVPGTYDRKDDKMIRVSGNEVVLTPRQWQPIAPYLTAAKVPGFANGGAVAPSAAVPQNINLTLNMYEREDGGFDSYLGSEQGERQVKVVINKLRKNREI